MSFSGDSGCIKQQIFQKDLSLYPDFQSEAHSCVNPPTLVGGSLVDKQIHYRARGGECDGLPSAVSRTNKCANRTGRFTEHGTRFLSNNFPLGHMADSQCLLIRQILLRGSAYAQNR